MSEFQKVDTLADLQNLNDDEILAGYRAGWSDAAEPGSDKSRSYWHGWRNAQIDLGRLPADNESGQLARAYVARWRAH